MKKIVILRSSSALTESDINEFEKKYQIQLPSNYKKFIQKFNGGYVDIDDEERDFIRAFNAIKYHENNPLLEDAIDCYTIDENHLEKEFLPIAYTYSNNPITLCLKSGELNGKIVLFYFDRIDEDPEIVADSLEELLGVESIDDL